MKQNSLADHFPRATSLIVLGLLSAVTTQASAEDNSRWWLRMGVAYADFKDDVTLKAMGNEIPGAGAKVKDNVVLAGQLGYRLTENWSVATTFGVPPKTNLRGTGTASSFGKLGETTYAPLALSIQYQFNVQGAFRPYLGVGYSYLKILESKDAFMQNLKVEDTSGPFILAGAEYWIDPSYGVFFDVTKYYLNMDASGTAGGAAANAHIVLDPVVMTTGFVFKF